MPAATVRTLSPSHSTVPPPASGRIITSVSPVAGVELAPARSSTTRRLQLASSPPTRGSTYDGVRGVALARRDVVLAVHVLTSPSTTAVATAELTSSSGG